MRIEEDEQRDLLLIYPLLGEFVVSFNEIVDRMEMVLTDWLIFSEHYRGSKVSGSFFKSNKPNNGINIDPIFYTYKKEAIKMVESSPYVYTLKDLRSAKKEFRLLFEDLETANVNRNIFIHSFWDNWRESYNYIKLSVPINRPRKGGNKKIDVNIKGYEQYQITVDMLKGEIDFLDAISERVVILWNSYQFGTNLPEKKFSKERYKQLKLDERGEWIPYSKRGFKNLNLTTKMQLDRIGIKNNEELKKIGPKKALGLLLEEGHPYSRRLLLSLIGSIRQLDWRIVAREKKGNSIS